MRPRRDWTPTLCAVLVLLVGCVAQNAGAPTPHIDEAATGVAKLAQRFETIDSAVRQAEPHADQTGRALLKVASQQAVAGKASAIVVGAELIHARAAAIALEAESAKKDAKLKDLDDDIIGPRGWRWFSYWAWAVVIAAAIRVAALFPFFGAFGPIMSYGSSLALTILSGGLTALVQIPDNAWFRWIKPTVEAAK